MPATAITNSVSGESLVATEPQLLQQVDPGWRRRLNLFTGRALTDTALDGEQAYRGGLLATLGQLVSAGTVNGLALTLDTSGIEPVLSVSPGYGISASGEDVVLNSPLKTALSTLTVIDGLTGEAVVDPVTEEVVLFHRFVSQAGNSNHAGILLLQPVIAQVSGEQLDTGALPAIVSGNLGASCDQDPAEYAFEDWQIADAVRLVYLPWPASGAGLALALPPLNPAATWRNRLAYTIFEAEAQLAPDDQLPWSMLGVPVALIGFDPGVAWAASTAFNPGQFLTDPNGNLQQAKTAGTSGSAEPASWNTAIGGTTTDGGVTWVNMGPGWKPLFVDCSAVVRAGGLPRNRFILPAQAPPLLQWQPKTAFVAKSFILDANNNVQVVQTAGTTGVAPPAWSTGLNQTTSDGSVVWINNGPGSWRPLTAFALGQFLFDSNGNQQQVLTAGTSGSTEPDWNGVYLPTEDGSVTWINNGTGDPPIVQPALAQARINQLSEQLSQTLAQQGPIGNLAAIFPTLPPSGILPATSLDFVHQRAVWFPPNWSVSAAPVFLEELETVLETGMLEAPIAAETSAPADPTQMEPVEVLIPLPDAVYDPDVLVHETVALIFQQEVDQATEARNLTLQQLETVTQELNALYAAWGPNAPANPNPIDPNLGLTSDEIKGRNTPPPYTPAASETFGTVLQTTWRLSTAYASGQFVIDGNGTIQVVTVAGTSGGTAPAWNTNVGQTTTDGGVTWLNNGPLAWQPDTTYVAGQFTMDPNGFLQKAQNSGTSASSSPAWQAKGLTTPDGIVWQNGGTSPWQPDSVFAAGQLILDSSGNVQIVQTAGISGDSAPAWNPNVNQTTQDSGVTWNNLGHSGWTSGTVFKAGQAVIDPTGMIQLAQVGGTSGAAAPAWNETVGGATTDAAINWINDGPLTWQASTAYVAGQIIVDSNGNLQSVQTAGTSGSSAPVWNTAPGGSTKNDGGVTWLYLPFDSTDISQLETFAAQAPYTFTYKNFAGTSQIINLIGTDDIGYLQSNGLQALITRLNARISQANDLLDTAFLTVQTDIYRYRQNVLGSNAASALATSPILANIATGETATATATNLQDYINTVIPPAGTPPPTYIPPVINPVRIPVVNFNAAASKAFAVAPPTALRSASISLAVRPITGTEAVIHNIAGAPASVTPTAAAGGFQTSITRTPIAGAAIAPTAVAGGFQAAQISKVGVQFNVGAETAVSRQLTSPTQILQPGQNANATTTDITSQSPMVGAQANIRTLTIAQRLQQSPAQEAMFYSISNRLNFLQILATLESFGFVADDLAILVDGTPTTPATPAPTTPVAVPVETHYFGEYLDLSVGQPALVAKLQNPYLIPDSVEATVFSVGVRVAEQHTVLLRALEARVQNYVDFVALCSTALANIQNDVQQAAAYLTQLQNNLHQDRQNVAFTTALLGDETQRVLGVNAQRLQILQNSVQLVAYTRARTLQATDTVPSRQLVPANVASPVPACLQQTVSIPPELREIVGLLREAPVNWMPSVSALMDNLERPILLQHLALTMQARSSQLLTAPLFPSSAAGEPGVYAPAISNVYSANQQIFRNYTVQRAAFQPSTITNLSWSVQVGMMQGIAAFNDLISSDAVHTEVSNAVARLIQQICSVSTCLYTRAGIELPVDRLAWAEYLSGPGASVQLSSLAILPNWNQLPYIDRQQMQLLADWLFQQIDTTNSAATAFMSDVVRTAILLASDVPVDNIIPGNIIARTLPVPGGVVSLNLPSDRISSGMYVNLYSGANLAARGVVSDLDNRSVTATVTDVFTPGVYLETSDTAHFTAQTPQAVALRPYLMS